MNIDNMTGNPCHIVDEYGDRIATIEPGPIKLKPYYAAGAVQATSHVEVDGEDVGLYPSDFDPEEHQGYNIESQLPAYDFDTLVLVPTWAISALVREGLWDRDDVVVAHQVVRDKDTGKAFGCRGLRFVFPEEEDDFDCSCGCGCGY